MCVCVYVRARARALEYSVGVYEQNDGWNTQI